MLRRPWLLAGALAAAAFVASPHAPLSGPRVAEARVSLAYTLPNLVDAAPWSVIGIAKSEKSAWEDVAGGRRIVTYTEVEITETIYGKKVAKTIWVRRLGGVVGKIGQQVAGEAVPQKGKPTLLFLGRTGEGSFAIAGAAQGMFPLVAPPKADKTPLHERRVTLSRAMGKLVRRPGPVVTVQQVLEGKKLSDAIELIRATKAARDAAKKR